VPPPHRRGVGVRPRLPVGAVRRRASSRTRTRRRGRWRPGSRASSARRAAARRPASRSASTGRCRAATTRTAPTSCTPPAPKRAAREDLPVPVAAVRHVPRPAPPGHVLAGRDRRPDLAADRAQQVAVADRRERRADRQPAADRPSSADFDPTTRGCRAATSSSRTPARRTPGPSSCSVPEIPGYVQSRPDRAENSLREISHQHEVSSGNVPAGVTAASAINLLQEADDTVLGPDIEDMELAIRDAGRRMLWLRWKFSTTSGCCGSPARTARGTGRRSRARCSATAARTTRCRPGRGCRSRRRRSRPRSSRS
jgi:hypothetical protein